MNRTRSGLLVVALLVLLASCAAPRAFREGNDLIADGKPEAGLEKLEEASRMDPRNPEYRLAVLRQREVLVNKRLQEAERVMAGGQLQEAEAAWRRVLEIDPANVMARNGLATVTQERRHRQEVGEAEQLFRKGTRNELSAAQELVRKVLAENPRQREALNLKARIDDARRKEYRPEAALAAAYRKPITLEFRDAPLKGVFDMIAKQSGLNFFFDKDVRPDIKTTILARDTAIEDAVRMLLVTNQLEQKILNENSVLIYPNTPQKQKDYQTLSVRTFYIANADVKAIASTLNTILKAKNVVVDDRLGILIVRDTPEVIRMAERLIALQDIADPEVMLDVEVLEVKRTRLRELGVRWPSQATFAPLTSGTTPITVRQLLDLDKDTITADVGNVQVNARGENTSGNILANPRIRVRNKEKAKVLIGDKVPVITTTSTSTGFVSDSVTYVDVGLKLEVEPRVYLDDDVAIKVELEVSNLVREVTSTGGTLAYQIGTRGASTTLRLKDGEPQILAGLISDEDRETANRIPGLGSLPVLGRLFGSQKDDKQRNEIVLSITPHIVRAIRRPDLIDSEFDSGTEAVVGSGALAFASAPPAKDASAGEEPAGDSEETAVMASKVDETTTSAPVPAPASESATVATVPATANTTTAQPASAEVPAGGMSAPVLRWQAPARVNAGEQFTAVLQVSTSDALRGLPMLIGFDPRVLQVAAVNEGDFFRQGSGKSAFNQRVDAAKGKVFATAIQSGGAGVNGSGSVVMITFKALGTGKTAISLLSATPEPLSVVKLPVVHALQVGAPTTGGN